jgi:ArsR family transcriptional regulator
MPKLLPTIQTLTGCCAPLAEAPLSEDDAAVLAARLKAVADPARLRLVSLVLASPGQEACICDLTAPLGLSQPTISHHMKVLVDAGLLVREKRGRWAYFRAVPSAFASLAEALQPTSVAR